MAYFLDFWSRLMTFLLFGKLLLIEHMGLRLVVLALMSVDDACGWEVIFVRRGMGSTARPTPPLMIL